MDIATLSQNVLNDIKNKKITITTYIDIIVFVMEMVEPLSSKGEEKLEGTLSIIDYIIREGNGIIPDDILNILEFLYNNKNIIYIIEVICKAFKRNIALLSKQKCCLKFKSCWFSGNVHNLPKE